MDFSQITGFLKISNFILNHLEKPQKFRGTIFVTYPNKDRFLQSSIISFLKKNAFKTIDINADLDLSLSTASQNEFNESWDDRKSSYEKLSGIMFPLPDRLGQTATECKYWVQFKLLNDRELRGSSGGTGIYTLRIRGLFDVERRYSGSNTYFYLTEIPR